jgi:nicotinate-nucleotide adenylyltransferase
MGGTFDPIHIGHLILAESAREAADLDEVRFIPSGHSYFKDQRSDRVSSPEDRLEMTRLAIAGNPCFSVSSMEIDRGGDTYTYETMEQLKAEEPETDFYFIAGADSIAQMRTWYRPERLFAVCTILAAVRSDETGDAALLHEIDGLKKDFSAKVNLLPMHNIQISSSEIRSCVRENRSIRYRVPDAVADYIREHALYPSEEDWTGGKQG